LKDSIAKMRDNRTLVLLDLTIFVNICSVLYPSYAIATLAPSFASGAVGTAFAPTTSGGACVGSGSSDYQIWTTAQTPDGENGFQVFPSDLQACTEFCFLHADAVEGCGGAFSSPACPSNVLALCVSDCMSASASKRTSDNFPAIQTSPYSTSCATCMGTLAFCGVGNCNFSCAIGSFSNVNCVTCNEKNCNPAFERCSGLNPAITGDDTNFVPIIIGSLGGGVFLLTLAVTVGYIHRQQTRKLKMMSPDELAILAKSQSMMMSGSSSNIYSGKIENASNPRYNPSVSSMSSGGNLPYPVKFQAQQQALALGADPRQSSVARSDHMSRLASRATASAMVSNLTRLVVAYDFVGERPDELTAVAGTKMFGIEKAEGWWLAQTGNGLVGLIPVSYTEVDNDTNPLPVADEVTLDPEF